MRILVLGASGYIGSRLVPALLEAGHQVVAASSSEPTPDRFGWGDRVEWARCDVTDRTEVESAVADVDGVCYLVHSLADRGFSTRDRFGAETVREAVDGADAVLIGSRYIDKAEGGFRAPFSLSRLADRFER